MLALCVLLGYLIGGIPFAVPVVLLLHGLDVRDTGSGNVGARNSLRVGGPLAGATVLLLDALKAALPMLLARTLKADAWSVTGLGVGVVLGHCYSPYLMARALRLPWPGWRIASLRAGGQGLASGLGVIAVLAPLIVLPVLVLGAAIIFGLKRSTAAAVAMILVAPAAALAVGYPVWAGLGLALAALIVFSKLLQDLVPET
jgi:glycerol-3-phosphate acyltransferase PlsY